MRIPGRVTILSLVLLLFAFTFFKPFDTSSKGESEKGNVQGVSTEDIQADQVKEVIDGDTFTLGNGEKVRLIGINTPERGQPYYEEAKSHLESLLSSRVVKLMTDARVQDDYGRILAYAYSDSDVDINLDMIKKGFAVTETISPNVARSEIFSKAQIEARNNCLGIWEGLCGDEGLCVQISEIHAISSDHTKNGEWVELANTCSSDVNLNGYLLKDNSASNAYTFKSRILGSKKSLKLFSGCGEDDNTALYWVCPEQQNYIWNDAGDRAYLYNSNGRLISELGY